VVESVFYKVVENVYVVYARSLTKAQLLLKWQHNVAEVEFLLSSGVITIK